MGKELRRRGVTFDLALASPARRVRETLEELDKGYGSRLDIGFDDRIYLASVATLLELVRDLPEDFERPLLVGHNPGLQHLLVELTRDDRQGFYARIEQAYPTAALAIVEFPATNWAEVETGSGEIVELILPRELD
jgi:phosphohistidine phosphatase